MIFRLGNRGDTIVEVLIAIAIVSLVFTGAYVTANHSYLSMEDTQERGNALKLLEREVEALKAYNAANPGQLKNQNGSFCIYFGSGSSSALTTVPNTGPNNQCKLNPDASVITAANAEPSYDIGITRTALGGNVPGDTYVLKATWDSILTNGQDHEQIEYRLYQ